MQWCYLCLMLHWIEVLYGGSFRSSVRKLCTAYLRKQTNKQTNKKQTTKAGSMILSFNLGIVLRCQTFNLSPLEIYGGI